MSAELRDAQEGPFEDWWNREGQYLRAGGDSYSKTFAWHAWCEATGRAQAPAAEPQWQPIETAPKNGRKLILSYRNRADKARTVMARWLTDEEAAETDADGVGLEGGWYECIDNWGEYTEVTINEGEPTHWMLPPPAPDSHPQPANKT